MKTLTFINGGTALLVLLFSSAMAQSSVDNNSSNAAASGSMTRKDIRMQNRATSRAVRKALYSVKGLQSDQITVVARGHVVTLEGSVPEESQIALAEAAVKNVPQVQETVNALTIREPGGH